MARPRKARPVAPSAASRWIVSRKELAWLFNVSEQTVRNYIAEGMPADLSGERGPRLDVRACLAWRAEREKAQEPDTAANSRARKLDAEVRLAEIEVAEKEGSVVGIDYLEQQVATLCERLAARIKNVPGKWAPRLSGLTTAEAQASLREMTTELLLTLSDISDDDLDPQDDDAPPGAGSVAQPPPRSRQKRIRATATPHRK